MIRRSFNDWKLMMQKKRTIAKLESLHLEELAEERSLTAYSDAAKVLYFGCIGIDIKIKEAQNVHDQRIKRHLDKAVTDIFKRVVLESDGNITCDDLRVYMRNAIILPDNEDGNNEKI